MCCEVLSTSLYQTKTGSAYKSLFQEFLTELLTPETLEPALQRVLVHKGWEVSSFNYLFFLYDSWWRWLASRWIVLGPCLYLPYDELLSSHGRKGSANTHTNRQSSESWPSTISSYCVSRKSCQTVTVCEWLGNVIICHEKQMKSRIWLKDRVFAQTRPFQNKETKSGSWQLTSAEEGWQFCTGPLCT